MNIRKMIGYGFLAKVEKRIYEWCNGWLSRVGRLVLVKSVLESMPVYWASLAWNPNSILGRIKQASFGFRWKIIGPCFMEKTGNPLKVGRWRLKKKFSFQNPWQQKNVWGLIDSSGLW